MQYICMFLWYMKVIWGKYMIWYDMIYDSDVLKIRKITEFQSSLISWTTYKLCTCFITDEKWSSYHLIFTKFVKNCKTNQILKIRARILRVSRWCPVTAHGELFEKNHPSVVSSSKTATTTTTTTTIIITTKTTRNTSDKAMRTRNYNIQL